MLNRFVNSDGQWLLSYYKILSKLVTFVFQGSVCCKTATDQKCFVPK